MHSYFRLARSQALKSPSRFRLGAVLTKKRKIISAGFNMMHRTHPIMNKFAHIPFTMGTHAEVHACIGVPLADLIGAEMYVYRVLKNGQPALSKPCKTCQNFLRSVGVSKVYYTTDSEEIGELEL